MAVLAFFAAALAGASAEGVRVSIKGADYSTEFWNDAVYYTAMVENLWAPPMSLTTEIRALRMNPSAGAVEHYYAATVHSHYLNPENGLAHQPPYAYRLLVPNTVWFLREFGISTNGAFLLVYCVGLGLMSAFVVETLAGVDLPPGASVIVSGGITAATIAAATPRYPDAAFLGLSMLAVWAAYRRRPALFALAAFLATCAREGGVALGVAWILVAHGGRRARHLTDVLPALCPVLALATVRALVEVPNPSIDYKALLGELAQPSRLLVGGCAMVVVALVSPLFGRLCVARTRRTMAKGDVLLWMTAVIFAFGSMTVASNGTRMALLVAPLVISPATWHGVSSHAWTVNAAFCTLGYGLADTLTMRAEPPFGSAPWGLAAVVAVAGSLLAAWRESNLERKYALLAPSSSCTD